MYKYTLHTLLLKLSAEAYSDAMDILPKLLRVSERTFKRWIYLREDEHFDIPHTKIILLASFFEISEIDLYNNKEYYESYTNRIAELKAANNTKD